MSILTDYDRAARLLALHRGGILDPMTGRLQQTWDSLPALALADARSERLRAVVDELIVDYRASFRSGAEWPKGPRGKVDVLVDTSLPHEQQDPLVLWRIEGDTARDAMRRELNAIVFDIDSLHSAVFTDLKSIICAGRSGELSWYVGMRFMLAHRSNL